MSPLPLLARVPFAVCFVLAVCVSFADTIRGDDEVPVLDVYRMLQYDHADQQLGSRKAALSLPAVPSTALDAARSVVVIEFSKLTEAKIHDILFTKKAGGLLIILPAPGDTVSPEVEDQWRQVEHNLMSREIPIPVYLTFDGENAKQLKAAVERGAGDTQLVVNKKQDPVKAGAELLKAHNFQAFLEGTGEAESGEAAKIIAVVAHTDSMGLAPGLSVGADSNGSGMAAVLQLARMFHRLYSSSRMQGKHSMIFVLTGAGKLDFAGTKHWLSSTDPRIVDRLDFVLCLDAIGGAAVDPSTKQPLLYVHSSKPAKDASLTRVMTVLNASAHAQGTQLAVVHKKINISDPLVSWEHEQFSRRRVMAVTLSRHPTHAAHLRSSVLDTTVDKLTLRSNVQLVANALARVVFELEDPLGIFEGAYGINVPFLEAFVDLAASEGRMLPHPAAEWKANGGSGGGSVLEKVEAVMKEISAEDHKQTFTLDPARAFYVNSNKATMSVYTVRPLSFDLAMSVAVCAYLLFLLVMLQGTQEAMKTLSEVFKGKGKKAKRS